MDCGVGRVGLWVGLVGLLSLDGPNLIQSPTSNLTQSNQPKSYPNPTQIGPSNLAESDLESDLLNTLFILIVYKLVIIRDN